MSSGLSQTRSGRFRLGILPILIWMLAALTTTALFYTRSAEFEAVGVARADQLIVTASGPGRLQALPVDLFKTVEPGETLAMLQLNTAIGNDNLQEQLLAQRQTAQAELDRLRAELEATRAQLGPQTAQVETDTAATHRRLALDVEQARLAVLDYRTTLEPERILLDDLKLEIEVQKKLVDEGAVDPYTLDKLKVQLEAQQAKVRQAEQALQQAEQNLKLSQQRLDEFLAVKPAPLNQEIVLEPLRKAITVQEQRLAELMTLRPNVLIKAPFKAVVSLISAREHQTVMEGEPIMTIVAAEPKDIVAYVKPERMDQVEVNKRVELVKRSRPRKVAPSQITYVGPSIERIPQRLWTCPDVPEYGLPVRIAYNPELHLLPNEVVGVRGL